MAGFYYRHIRLAIIIEYVSVEYELDIEKLKNSGNYDYFFSLKDELDFLNEEQYELFIKALIMVYGIDWFATTNHNLDEQPESIHYLWKDNDDNYSLSKDFYIKDVGESEYAYLSTYKSFYEYLLSVFTNESTEEIINYDDGWLKRFIVVDSEIYTRLGDRGSKNGVVDGYFKLSSKEDDLIAFEYISNYSDDTVEVYDIILEKTDNGWRSRRFDYWF